MAFTHFLPMSSKRIPYARAKSNGRSEGQVEQATMKTALLISTVLLTTPACEFPPIPSEDGESSSADTTAETFGSETADGSDSPSDADTADASTATGDGDDGDAGDGDGDGEPTGFWAEIACIDALCVGRRSGAKTWTQVVHSSDLDVEPESPIGGPCTPDGFPETRCIQAGPAPRCFGGDGEWFAPFTCGTEPGPLGWPMWMCGESLPIFVSPWDSAGCHDELAESCIAKAGEAAFEIWPDCYIQSLLP